MYLLNRQPIRSPHRHHPGLDEKGGKGVKLYSKPCPKQKVGRPAEYYPTARQAEGPNTRHRWRGRNPAFTTR